jgi:hypothetical protein
MNSRNMFFYGRHCVILGRGGFERLIWWEEASNRTVRFEVDHFTNVVLLML